MSTGTTDPVECWVYKGSRQPDMYLYLPAPDNVTRVPSVLLERLGPLELALRFELTPERTLARASAVNVIAALNEQGFYLQMPPTKPS